MMPGRFFLGVGTGREPERARDGRQVAARRRSARDARGGGQASFAGSGGAESGRIADRTTRVESARLYTLPPRPPPIMVAASGPKAARLAGRIGDGFVTTDPDPALLRTFRRAGGRGKPSFVEVSVCWAQERARSAPDRPRGLGAGGSRGLPVHGDRPARALRGRVQADHGGPGRRGRGLRARPRPSSRRDPAGEPGGIRPRLRAPDRPRPGRLRPLLRGRGPPPAPTRSRRGGRSPAVDGPRETWLARCRTRVTWRRPRREPGPPGRRRRSPSSARSAAGCRACELWERATQTVFGEGPAPAEVDAGGRAARPRGGSRRSALRRPGGTAPRRGARGGGAGSRSRSTSRTW